MALRLLPAFNTDNDDDDDGNFTKWMSSYWGHGAEGSRDRKRIRRPAGAASASRGDRRASLPTVSQLDAMKLNRLHAASMASGSGPVKTREEGGEARNHQRARRASSDDNSRSKSAIPENRISTIPELAESFERRLFLRDKRTTCLNDDVKSCRICHEDMKKSGGAVHELHCSHHVHREASRRPEGRLAHSEACQARRFSNERRRSADGPLYLEREELTPQRQLSLRSHR